MSLQTCFFTAFHHYFELLETNGDHTSLQTCFFTAFHHYFETNGDHMSLETCSFTAFHQYFELLETKGDHTSLETCFFTAFHQYFELLLMVQTRRHHASCSGQSFVLHELESEEHLTLLPLLLPIHPLHPVTSSHTPHSWPLTPPPKSDSTVRTPCRPLPRGSRRA